MPNQGSPLLPSSPLVPAGSSKGASPVGSAGASPSAPAAATPLPAGCDVLGARGVRGSPRDLHVVVSIFADEQGKDASAQAEASATG